MLTSNLLPERASHKVDDVIIASLPLLFVGRHGNKFTGIVAEVLAGSKLAQVHPMLERLREVLESEGVCTCVWVGVSELKGGYMHTVDFMIVFIQCGKPAAVGVVAGTPIASLLPMTPCSAILGASCQTWNQSGCNTW